MSRPAFESSTERELGEELKGDGVGGEKARSGGEPGKGRSRRDAMEEGRRRCGSFGESVAGGESTTGARMGESTAGGGEESAALRSGGTWGRGSVFSAKTRGEGERGGVEGRTPDWASKFNGESPNRLEIL